MRTKSLKGNIASSKKIEKEVKLVHDLFWKAYAKRDIDLRFSLCSDDVTFIGSGLHERAINKSEYKKINKAGVKQFPDVFRIKFLWTHLTMIKEDVVCVESEVVWSQLINKKVSKELLRNTTLLKCEKNKWLVTHVHGSVPDYRLKEGNYMTNEQTIIRNKELERQVFERTRDLKMTLEEIKLKNRELEIESTLEKVRTIAMGMREPADMLDVCKTIAIQLQSLGVKEIRNVQTAIFYEQRGTYMNYEYYAKHDKSAITDTTYTNNKLHEEFALKMMKGKGEVFITHIKGKEVKDWIVYQKTTNVFIDSFLETASSLNYYWFSLGPVALGISTYHPLADEEINLFKRFLKVFELAYQRYLDIEKAEAQAREAEIQLALERVRARTMAMHKSEELLEAGELLYREITRLGIVCLTSGYVLMDEKENVGWNYAASPKDGKIMSVPVGIPHLETEVMRTVTTSWKKGEPYSIIQLDPEATIKHQTFIAERSTNFPLTAKELIAISPEQVVLHNFNFKHGYLLIVGGVSLTAEQIDMMVRFSKVFEMTYRRFLDLKQAEAQAREAQIELALERVRARTMAMHKSDELLDTAVIISKEMIGLSVSHFMSGFVLVHESLHKQEGWLGVPELESKQRFFLPLTGDSVLKERFESWKKEEQLFFQKVGGKKLTNHLNYVSKYFESEEAKENAKHFPDTVFFYCGNFKEGYLHILVESALNKEQEIILSRFTKVFQQTYTRFLDLQRAEAQAKEAQLEAALERVRSRTMGMQKSDELQDAAVLLFQQVVALGVPAFGTGFNIWDDDRKYATAWMGGQDRMQPPFKTSSSEDIFLRIYEAAEKGESLFVEEQGGEALKIHYEYMNSIPVFKKIADKMAAVGQTFPTFQIMHCAFFSHGYLMFISFEPVPGAYDTFKRFAKVFEQTYTRFLDLQKAEEQAREAQVQLALERVRARSLAMHHTSELQDVVNILAQQLYNMNIDINGGVFIAINDEVDKDIPLWASGGAADYVQKVTVPFFNNPVFIKLRDAIKRKNNFFTEEHSREEKIGLFEHLFNYPPWNSHSQQRKHELLSREGGYTRSVAISQHTSISITNHNGKKFSDDDNEILKRFGSVFEQSYIRFLDLQKAEAQAREAQIEAALEKVRSRSLAMHATNELGDVVTVIVEKLKDLGVVLDANGVVLCTYFRESKDVLHWIASPDFSFAGSYLLPYFDHPIFNDAWESKESGAEYFSKAFTVEEKNSFFEYAFKHSDYKQFPDDFKQWIFQNDKHILSFAWQKNSAILIPSHTGVLPSVDDVAILKRFANVFEQSYTRFLDLQKAEAQARESKIEVSLERVRSKAMAMHSPDDLSETVNVFFKELKTLGIIPIRCGVGQIDEETRTTSLTTTTSSQQGDSFKVIGKIKQTGHPVLDGIFENWKLQKEYHPVLEDEDIKAYYSVMNPQIGYPDYPEDVTQYGNSFPFKEGFVFAWTENKLSEEELQIFRRFTSVLSLTYRRYLDLKEAEVRAFEAVREASLDRVRAEIASMRTAEDLNHITPIIWRELKTLEVPFIRCGVFIIDEEQSNVQVYLSTPDGKSLGALNLPIGFSALTSNSVEYWRKKKVYKEYWSKEQFIRWTKSMIEQRQVQNAQTYQGSSAPPESLNLHFVPFAQGMLYVGDISPLSEEKLQLVKSLAEGFSIAYARYEDFKNLEDAKNRVESTLKELKSAQAQLIHSEKMASLGELTAGIAHEIKNPLNFVNNFSELSQELLEDLKEELENSNKEEVMAIVNDVKQNLEKINQHGKRADSIVKGMLLHSRGTSGEKTLTDLNNLLDQYVTLAYHGLRAQDKEFNITIEKDFDETVGKINVVPQDISRVFLNIINNACYAAYDKKKKNSDDNFSPTLKVSTNNLEEKIEIRIRDNGNGIPIEIRDKLFNPFFTTKPTGEGTGLGLSLSYDIVVKQHSGEIKFESEEGNYTEFTITLPQK